MTSASVTKIPTDELTRLRKVAQEAWDAIKNESADHPVRVLLAEFIRLIGDQREKKPTTTVRPEVGEVSNEQIVLTDTETGDKLVVSEADLNDALGLFCQIGAVG